MEILKQDKFIIEEITENSYVFYNSIRHFASKIDKLTLYILNLIYKHESLEEILLNIDVKYHNYIR
jgi:hypothetical protein